MALSAFVVWEVRPGSGSDTACGGGFDPSVTSPGTDYSQQNSAQVSYTDLVIGGTNTQLTSAGNPFGSADVGNIIQITSGTGFTTGFYTVVSVSGTTATMDRAVGTASSTGGNGYLGGALNTISKAVSVGAAGQTIYFKGTYTVTAVQVISFDSAGVGSAFTINGYASGGSRNDGSKGTWTTATNSINLVDISSLACAAFRNIAFTNTAATVGSGTTGNAIVPVSANAWGILFSKCSFSGFNTHVNLDWQNIFFTCVAAVFDQCEFGTSIAQGIRNTAGAYLYGCLFTGCGTIGYELITSTNAQAFLGPVVFEGCVFYQCGAQGILNQNSTSPYGIIQTPWIKNCLFHSNVGDGVSGPASGGSAPMNVINSAFWNNGGYGVNNPSGNTQNTIPYGNAYGSNTSGARNNFPASSGGDIALTADPCVSASTGNFALNAAAGGGAACTGTGWQSDIL